VPDNLGKPEKILARHEESQFYEFRNRGHSLVVKRYPSKLDMRVRFPLPAPFTNVPKFANLVPNMKQSIFFGVFSALLALISASAEVDCLKLSLTIKAQVAAEQSKVLEIVSTEVSATPACACEIVKAAIEASAAKPETVAAIVEAAITAAPDQMRLVSQCAVAVAPDSLAKVQAVLAKYDLNRGESVESSKDAKDAKEPVGEVAAMPNPLDFPGKGPIGPMPGQPGFPSVPNTPPVIINPPDVSGVNP
jgi:hypothetical protein